MSSNAPLENKRTEQKEAKKDNLHEEATNDDVLTGAGRTRGAGDHYTGAYGIISFAFGN